VWRSRRKEGKPKEEEFVVHSIQVKKKFFCRLLPTRKEKLCLHHVTIELLLQQTFQLSGENNANNKRLKYYLPVEV
jgi:hypothetical protein